MDTVCREHAISIRSLYSVCRSFDSLLEKTLGPNGKNALLNAPTGQVLITDVGCTILTCVNMQHPLGTMIIKSIDSHHNYAGDGSKTFMLYLTSILNSIANYSEEILGIHGSEQRHSLLCAVHYIRGQLLSNVLLPAVNRNCCIMDICQNKNATMTVMRDLVKSHLCGKYTQAIRSHLCQLLVNFLCSRLSDFRNLSDEISVCIDNFNLLCIDVDCMLPLSSYIYEGIVIQRDFLNFHHSPPKSCHTRFILIHNSFTKGGSQGEVSSTFEAKDIPSLDKVFLWKNRCSASLIDWVQKNSVNLILSTGCIDDMLHTLCSKAGISMVQFVDKEDFERLKVLFHVTPIEFISDLFEINADDFIGCSDVCEAKVFGQKRFVCLKFPDWDHIYTQKSCTQAPCDHPVDLHTARKCCSEPESLRRQLVICGMSAGACQQIRLDLLHSLKILRLWLDSKWQNTEAPHYSAFHIAGGGTFEMICYDAVQHFMKQNALQLSVRVCCEALCAAVLAVPLRLLRNGFQPKLATVLYIEERIKTSRESAAGIRGFDGYSGCQLSFDTTIIEPLSSKMLLLDHILQLTEQLLRIDSFLLVEKLL